MKLKEPYKHVDVLEYYGAKNKINCWYNEISIEIENKNDYLYFLNWCKTGFYNPRNIIVGKYNLNNFTLNELKDDTALLNGGYGGSIEYLLLPYMKNEIELTETQLKLAVSQYSAEYMDNMLLELPNELFNERLLNILESYPNNTSYKIANWARVKIKLNMDNYDEFCKQRYARWYPEYRFASFNIF